LGARRKFKHAHRSGSGGTVSTGAADDDQEDSGGGRVFQPSRPGKRRVKVSASSRRKPRPSESAPLVEPAPRRFNPVGRFLCIETVEAPLVPFLVLNLKFYWSLLGRRTIAAGASTPRMPEYAATRTHRPSSKHGPRFTRVAIRGNDSLWPSAVLQSCALPAP
jgi:hypothetical protein